MTVPRVLVVRSGPDPFAASSSRVEIVERISHRIEPVRVEQDEVPARVDLVVFTSRVAVDRALGVAGSSLARRISEAAQVFAVGPSTEAALRARGFANAVAGGGTAEALLATLPERLDGRTALFPCGDDALNEIPDGLRARGAGVTPVVVYRKVPNPADPSLEREILEKPFAAFCATAPSAAQWLFEGVGRSARERLCAMPAVVLGMSTLRALTARGVLRIEVTEEPSFAAAGRLLEALATGRPGN